MSSTVIKAIYPGVKSESVQEFKNSFRGAPIIWTCMEEKYLNGEKWMFASDKLWALSTNKNVPEYERAVLMMTYDHAYIAKDHYARAANDLKQFFQYNLIERGHWELIKNLFESNPDIPAIGFHHTTVVEDLFGTIYDEEGNELPYDWSIPYEIYDELDGVVKNRLMSKEEKIHISNRFNI